MRTKTRDGATEHAGTLHRGRTESTRVRRGVCECVCMAHVRQRVCFHLDVVVSHLDKASGHLRMTAIWPRGGSEHVADSPHLIQEVQCLPLMVVVAGATFQLCSITISD